MIQLKDLDLIYVDKELAPLTARLAEEGTVQRQVDLLLIGYAYAIQQKMKPKEKIIRHDLIRAGALGDDNKIAIELTAPWYTKEQELQKIETPKQLLEFTCKLASAGLEKLAEKWKERTKSQIELAILKLATE